MKRLFIGCLAFLCSTMTWADNAFSIDDFTIAAGEKKTIEVKLTNDIAVCAFQFELELPEGVSITAKTNGSLNVIATNRLKEYDEFEDTYVPVHTIVSTLQGSGLYRVMAYAMPSTDIKGPSGGAVVKIQIEASDLVSTGSFTPEITNMELTEKDGTRHTIDATTYNCNVVRFSTHGCITLEEKSASDYEVTIDGDKLEDNTLTTGNIPAKKVTYKRTFNTPYATVCLPFAVNQETADAVGEFYQFTSVNGSYEVVMTKVTEGGLLANTAYIVKPKSQTDEVKFIYENNATPITFPLTTECSTPTAATESDWHFKGVWTVTTFQDIAEGTAIYFFAYSSQGGISPGDFVKTNTASTNTKCAPFRAYLEYTGDGDLTGTTGGARRMTQTIDALPERMKVVISESNGTTTEIGTISVERDNDTWFSFDGRKLNSKPVKKGLYINNGKKLVIK